MPQIEVTFDIDANGIINVSAKDKASNREQKITITASSGLSEAEIDKMIKDAEAHAAEDERRRELIEVKNQAESTIFTAEKLLTDFDDRLPEDAKTQTNELIEAVRGTLESEDVAQIQSTTESLTAYIQQLGGQMYQQGDAGATADDQAAGGTDANKSDEDVIDAEFTDA